MRLSDIRRGKKEITTATTVADKLLLIALIFLSAWGFIFIKNAFPQGTDVIIEVDGKQEYRLPLNSDTVLSVKGKTGDTVVEIKDRRVRIKESSCPNKICIHNGWIERGAIICLPNKVIVRIGGAEDNQDKTIDAITG